MSLDQNYTTLTENNLENPLGPSGGGGYDDDEENKIIEHAPLHAVPFQSSPAVANYKPYDRTDGWSIAPTVGGNEVGATGLNMAAIKRVLLSEVGRVRLLTLFLSMLTFSIMSNQNQFSQQASFGFLVFTGVTSWLFCVAMWPCYIFDLHNQFSWLYACEVCLDGLFALFACIAGITSARRCEETMDNGDTVCAGTPKPRWASAFCIMLGIAHIVATIVTFRRFQYPPRGGTLPRNR